MLRGDKMPEKKDKPEIFVDKIRDGWVHGRVRYYGRFRFLIKVDDKPSKYGINKGYISGLQIIDYEIQAEYGHGIWRLKPESDVVKTVYRAIVRKFNKGLPYGYTYIHWDAQ